MKSVNMEGERKSAFYIKESISWVIEEIVMGINKRYLLSYLLRLFFSLYFRLAQFYSFVLVPYWICEKTSFVLGLYKARTCSLLFSSVGLKTLYFALQVLLCNLNLWIVMC